MDIRKRKIKGYLALSIMLVLCIVMTSAMIFFTPNKNADAIKAENMSSKSTDLGKLLLDGYENDTTGTGKVFNGNVLWSLINVLSNGTVTDKTQLDNWDLTTPLTSADFRANNKDSVNGEKDIVVTIGGKQWIATYVSRSNGTATNPNGDPILTLWLANGTENAQWSAHANDNKNDRYPSSMYGTSYVRAVALNNGGDYAQTSNASSLTGAPQSTSSVWAMYTMEKADVNTSIKSFLELPENMSWQLNQTAIGTLTSSTYKNTYYFNNNNDALTLGGTSAIGSYLSKTNYDVWGTDTLWLPSVTETGVSGEEGLWKATNSTRENTASSTSRKAMTRSAYYSYSRLYYSIMESGDGLYDSNAAGTSGVVRPAFHLNLNKAADAALTFLTKPENFNRIYEDELTPKGEDWYTSSLQNAIQTGDVTEKYRDGQTPLPLGPINAGTYTIDYEIVNSTEFMWSDKTTGKTTITFQVDKKDIKYPSITDASKTYNGSSGVKFELKDFSPNIMDLNWKGNYTGVSINTSTPPYSVGATTVGKYELIATINSKNAINYKFSSTPKREVEVTPAPLVIEKIVVHNSGSNSNFNISEGTASISADIFVDVNGTPLAGDVVPIVFYIPYDSNPANDVDISQAINLNLATLQSTSYQLTNQQLINLGNFFSGNSYNIKVKTNDKNYEVSLKTPAKLIILSSGERTNILWKMLEDGIENTRYRTVTELNDTSVKAFPYTLVYSGKQFEFEVDYPQGYTLDSNYGTGGYRVEKINGSGNALGKDAGTYKTSIKFDGRNEIYSVEWTIDKEKFDLTNVKWEHDGKIPFSTTVSDMVAKIDASTLPKGLVVDSTCYTGIAQGNHADDTNTVTVAFKYDTSDPSYALNYELPEQGGKDTNYTFNGTGDFAWDMTWKIEKLVIKVEWMSENYNNKYNRQTLKEDKRVVDYEYYLWDAENRTTIGSALREEQIEIVENEVHYYVTKAVIKSNYANDAEFDKTDVFSPPFAVGESSTAVNVDLTNKELTYNGEAQQVKLKLDVALSDSDFDFVYYDKNSTPPLTGSPTNVGDYRVEIKLKSSVSGYHLAGDNVEDRVDGKVAVIEYSIKRMQVKNDTWNTLHNPPSLKVTAKEMKGIKHEYADMDGNSLQFSDLKAGNTYKVRAVITDKNNYVFADGTTETEWQEFTVSANEQIYDPDDPNNPFYPGEGNENPTPPTDSDGPIDFGKVGEALKQWWQVIASAISIVLIIAFTAKGLDYASKKKENNRQVEKYSTFYAATGLFGISMTNWTIIACIFMGVAALAFIFMMLEKSGYKKSQRALEDTKDEYNRMMFMRGNNINGGMGMSGQQGIVYTQQPQFAIEDMRGMINEAMSSMLPNVTQYLPQQASVNDELVQQLIEQNAQNEERIRQLTEENEEKIRELTEQNQEIIRNLANGQEMLMQRLSEQSKESVDESVIEKLVVKLSKQQDDEKSVEKEVAATNANDEKIEMLMRNQEMLMKQIMDLSSKVNTEKQVVVPFMQQPIIAQPSEKVVERIIEKPVEKIIEKEVKVEVPVEVEKVVEKVVEKEVVKEVPIEVEKVVEKIV
ncbi:MAG: hypothetical protein HDT32_05730, partial [Clostridiales bacterium]|nr:hypothetical protein [Clostridiales bacterium]